ncbi:MAG: keto-hydroxyglutarate-aldolase/keto-deoxy-phosphogluconate aldolase, partial [Phycisphaeraceae bacterium]
MSEINPAIQSLVEHRVIPVIALPDADLAEPLGDALVEAGLPCAEITFRTPAAVEGIRRLASRGDLAVSAGTVLSIEQAERATDA